MKSLIITVLKSPPPGVRKIAFPCDWMCEGPYYGREHRYSSNHSVTSSFRKLMTREWIFKTLQRQHHTHTRTHTQAALWALPPSLNNIHSPFLTYLKVTQHCSKVLQFFSFTYKQLLQKLYKNCNKILLYSWESITSLLREGWRIGEWEATLAFSSEKFVLICMRWEIGTLLFITVNILFNYVLVIPKDTGRYFSAYFLMFEFYVEIRGHLI